MGCCGGDREKDAVITAEQKWDYVNLDDFKSNSCWTPFTYGFLWFNLFISVAVYSVDTFTAINLLVFDRWSGQIKPAIPLHISRWIFAGCIILSFVLLFYRWVHAVRVMRASGVAQSYLDPLAVRIQSIRMGKEGRGWKRFLVFAELTKSRKGADYVALFTYYSFEAWIRIVFAEGPRQVINALTLYSVLRLNLIPQGQHAATDGHSPIIQFFVNLGVLAGSNREQAVILFGMLFTLVIWVITALSLAISMILYLVFLWHHIPSEDGSLSTYCRRKINRRMERVIKVKVDKALKKENELRDRQEAKEGRDLKRQPTLPNLEPESSDTLPILSRQTTQTTLPAYTSRRESDRSSGDSLSQEPTLPDVDAKRPLPPLRTATQSSAASWRSYGSNAPLMRDAGQMGYGGRAQTPESSASAGSWGSRPPPSRSNTGMSETSQRSYTPGVASRNVYSPDGRGTPVAYQMEPIARPGTAMGAGGSLTPRRGPSPSPADSQGRRTPVAQYNPYFPPLPEAGRNTPINSNYYRQPSAPQHPPRTQTPTSAYPPRSFTPGRSRPPVDGNVRSATLPVQPSQDALVDDIMSRY